MNRTLTYDSNGNISSDGGTRTFEWDGANRLVAINYTGFTTRSEWSRWEASDIDGKGESPSERERASQFTYDGLSRMVKIVEKTGGAINSTAKVCLERPGKCEYRDAADAVTMRIFPQGQHNGTTPYSLLATISGSVREVLSGGGTVVARYDYDPYGRSTTILGTTPTDMNFTGLYRHSKSNLDLATYRAYDPDLGRWLNRDPIAEKGGLNLYRYVNNDPIKLFDVLGLDPYLPDRHMKPPGWNSNWPTGTDSRGDYTKGPDGTKWYPHPEDKGHWPHYDTDKQTRFPQKCEKPWPNQKVPPYGDQSPTNPWPSPPGPSWWQRIRDFPFFRVPVLVPHPDLWMNPNRGPREA